LKGVSGKRQKSPGRRSFSEGDKHQLQTSKFYCKNYSLTRLKIAYLTVNDPLDKRSWSGITYYLGQSLQRNVGDVDFLGPIKQPWLLDKYLRALAKFSRIVFKKEYNTKYSLILSWYAGRALRKKMKGRQYDCVVAPAASTEFAFFKSDFPSVYVSDTTFILISNFYKKEFENLSSFSRWEGNLLEKRSLRKSDFVILSSHWAEQSAIKDYGIPAEKIIMQQLGANIDFVPSANMIFEKEKNQTLTLLYLAVEWERKGGSIAYDTLIHLRNSGIPARLIICGCIPPPEFVHPDMEVIPFLNKNLPEDHEKFVHLLSTSHFLLLPTRADCSLLVACEANSYGMPAISTITGGVPDVVKDGVNGYCLPFEAGGADYAAVINRIFNDKDAYHKMIQASRKRYEEILNWDKWAERFLSFYQEHISGNNPSPVKNIEKNTVQL
jgi:glycosyltransferase involved in cell wall biosynthesis